MKIVQLVTTADSFNNWRGRMNEGLTELNRAVKTVASVGGTLTIDLSLGSVYKTTLTENTTIAFSNFPSSGYVTKPVTSITRVSTTATVVVNVDHGLTVGDLVTVAGATQSEYNGTFVVTGVPATNQFTYTVSGSPATPATGTITWVQASKHFINFTLIATQNGTGTWTVTWPGAVLWSGGTPPTQTATANKTDLYKVYSATGGTDYYGNREIANL